VLGGLGGCARDRVSSGPSLFERYVLGFQPQPPEGCVVPVLQPLPEEVYESSRVVAREDRPQFEDLVCLYLAKYHLYYLRHCHQAYSLVAPDELGLAGSKTGENDKFFMLRAFLEFSGYRVEEEDGLPSYAVVEYCRTKSEKSEIITNLLRDADEAEGERP